MPSEELHGIIKQPPETCPLINDGIQLVGKCADAMRGYERMNEEEMRKALSEIEIHLSYLVGYRGTGVFEDVRHNVIAIRHWGQLWKDAAKHYYDHREEGCPNASDVKPNYASIVAA